MKKLLALFVVAASLVTSLSYPLSAQAADADATATATEAEGLAVGDPAPAWTDLAGIDNQAHSLGDLKDAKAIVVVFTCNHCPVAVGYEDRLVALAADYADKGVELVAINVSNLDADKLPAMKERAEEKGFKFAYLYDPSQQIGRAFGAAKTPQVFLLDGDRNVAYMGAIDDSMNATKVTKNYLRDAIDSVLAGNKPATASTESVGCGIRYE